MRSVLVTGGAGFIGSFIVDALLEKGHSVRVFDALLPQVHGEDRKAPAYLSPNAELVEGDVRDREAVKKALDGIDTVFHEASAVGVGQSMYQVAYYTDVNCLGTAVLLDVLANERHGVKKMMVASSMSIYGEGQYECASCGPVFPKLRPITQLESRDWEMKCPQCGRAVASAPTGEGKPLLPTSVYAVSKRDQEEMCLSVGRAYDIPTVALRYFNVYGPRQALSNPYTGVAAIFSSRLLNGQPPVVFEDGRQGRDFVHVSDIVQANLLAMESDEADYEVFNVGTGRLTSLLELVDLLNRELREGEEPIASEVVGKFRVGDVRDCFADVSKIRGRLGYEPKVSFEEGCKDLAAWVRSQMADDKVDTAIDELAKHGLTR